MIRRFPNLTRPERFGNVLIPLAALLLAAAFALTGSVTATAAGFALLGLAAAGLLMMRWPGLGPLLLVPASLLAPFRIGTGTQSEINPPMVLVAGLTLLWLVRLVATPGRPSWRPARAEIALIVLAGVFGLALLVGQGRWLPLADRAPLSAQIGELGIVFLSIASFFIAAEEIPDERWLKATVALFLGLGSIFAVGVLFRPLQPVLLRLYQPGATSSQFWIWLCVLAFGQAVYNRRLGAMMRVALAGLAFIAVYSVYVNIPGWVSGWLPALAGLVVIFALRSRWTFLLCVAGLIVLSPFVLPRVFALDAYSYSTRVQAWGILSHIIGSNPILGLGPANYYWYTPLFALSGYYGLQFNSHNQYVDLVAQTGLLGLAILVWFVIEMVIVGWQTSVRAPEGFGRAYAYSILGGGAALLVAGMLGDWLLPFVYNVGFMGLRSSLLGWLFLGALLALARWTSAQATAHPIE
jgi:hypothetical protein